DRADHFRPMQETRPGVGAYEVVPGRLLGGKGVGLMLEPAHGDTRHISSLHNSAICGDHIIAMRRVLPVLLMLGVAACAPPMRWEKPGATAEMLSFDMTSCRQAAQQEAMRYPFG